MTSSWRPPTVAFSLDGTFVLVAYDGTRLAFQWHAPPRVSDDGRGNVMLRSGPVEMIVQRGDVDDLLTQLDRHVGLDGLDGRRFGWPLREFVREISDIRDRYRSIAPDDPAEED